MKYYAHTHPDYPDNPDTWQPLEDHLKNVAEMAAEFARPFGGEDWAYVAGLWHDLGKYSDAFQKKLYDANGIESHIETIPGKVIHSEAGGHWAQLRGWKGIDQILCWLIMGHHVGLADYGAAEGGASALQPKMRHPEQSHAVIARVPDVIRSHAEPSPPGILASVESRADIAFFIRMLFSCIVDADFLDTERFMNKDRNSLRTTEWLDMACLLERFDEHMRSLCTRARPTEVNAVRSDVLRQCQEAAEKDSGVYALTVPTGGGKTLASMAFALRHAVRHGKRRIFYVIPYTSIIEQTADVFRCIPGLESAVLEHHSNVADDESVESACKRLASENWDMPIVVTTSVQFFESLFAAKTSRCRKLHNIADSVVILDEAQCLPPNYLRPVVFALRELNRHYGVTPVLCTATQPVLTKREHFDFRFREGFERVIDIIKTPIDLAARLKRVKLTFPNREPLDAEQLASHLRAEGGSVLCIVNRKDAARCLAHRLPDALHLSTNMCAEHRAVVLSEIKRRLKQPCDPTIVVSTSLVEAGVDLDFPVVYRALAGLDSIAQAAGRCNREGRGEMLGRTVVFVPENQPDYVKTPASLALEFLNPGKIDHALTPDGFRRYFEQRFFQLGEDNLDAHRIMELLAPHMAFAFRTAAEHFRLIEDDWQRPMIMPYGEGQALVDRLLDHRWESRLMLRRLQRFTISIPKPIHRNLLDRGHAHEVAAFPGLYVLHDSGLYSTRYGFVSPDKIENYAVEMTIV